MSFSFSEEEEEEEEEEKHSLTHCSFIVYHINDKKRDRKLKKKRKK